jgi:fructan beta-fructosidase
MPIDSLPEGEVEIRILLDVSSIELFIHQGQYVMTNQIFTRDAYTTLEIFNISNVELQVKGVRESAVAGIWKN